MSNNRIRFSFRDTVLAVAMRQGGKATMKKYLDERVASVTAGSQRHASEVVTPSATSFPKHDARRALSISGVSGG